MSLGLAIALLVSLPTLPPLRATPAPTSILRPPSSALHPPPSEFRVPTSEFRVPTSNSPLATAQHHYQSGNLTAAIALWESAIEPLQRQGDLATVVRVWSYLALAYQQQGQPALREQALTRALQGSEALLRASSVETLRSARLLRAQVLNHQAEILLSLGDAPTALTTWQAAESFYSQAHDWFRQVPKDRLGILGSQFNQARALYQMGFYRRSRQRLEALTQQVRQQPTEEPESLALQVRIGLAFAQIQRLSGEQAAVTEVSKSLLAIAQQIQQPDLTAETLVLLGHAAQDQQDWRMAQHYYQAAIATMPPDQGGPLQLHAALHLWELGAPHLSPTQPWSQIQGIHQRLQGLPLTRSRLHGQLHLVEVLLRSGVGNRGTDDVAMEQVSLAEDALRDIIQGARSLGLPLLEVEALGLGGYVCELTQRWVEARSLTQRAWIWAEQLQSPELSYRWAAQMGRILCRGAVRCAPEHLEEAIAAYGSAADQLRQLRQDLVLLNRSVQFSFRDRIDPIYRRWVDLLLQAAERAAEQTAEQTAEQPLGQAAAPVQAYLHQAQIALEELHRAELTDFLRAACLDLPLQDVERPVPGAVVVYPLILEDRLAVLVRLPDQSLRTYSTPIPATQVHATLHALRQSLRSTSFESERLPPAQGLYDWLIRPCLENGFMPPPQPGDGLNPLTLVLIPDGALRNVPLAVLHDGQHYLIERYPLAIAPSLRWLVPRALPRSGLRVLVGSLETGGQGFAPLPAIAQEIAAIRSLLPTTVLRNGAFTLERLRKAIAHTPFTVLHLATHGQFSMDPSQTFLLSADGRISLEQLDDLLGDRPLYQDQPLDLLVLSACQTAQGDAQATLGLAGMALRSGARSTLATLWAVDDASTAQFMQRFYTALAQGKTSRAEAVRQAQTALMQSHPHPFYWAPFVLLGSWL